MTVQYGPEYNVEVVGHEEDPGAVEVDSTAACRVGLEFPLVQTIHSLTQTSVGCDASQGRTSPFLH